MTYIFAKDFVFEGIPASDEEHTREYRNMTYAEERRLRTTIPYAPDDSRGRDTTRKVVVHMRTDPETRTKFLKYLQNLLIMRGWVQEESVTWEWIEIRDEDRTRARWAVYIEIWVLPSGERARKAVNAQTLEGEHI